MNYETISRITKALDRLPMLGKAAVMPDYFVDRFVRIDSLDVLFSSMKKKSFEGGGGSVRGVRQTEVKGGNAVNVGYALGVFGAKVNLTAIADALPAEMLTSTFGKLPNVELHIIRGKAGYTVAFEYREGGRHVNVMISDVGDLANFDGSRLSQKSLKSVTESEIAAIVNWSGNKKGNDLCTKVFSLAKKNRVKTFFDPADVSGQKELLPSLRKYVFDLGLIDYVSLNENEARIISKELFKHNLPMQYTVDELKKTANILSEGLGTVIDLHTRDITFSAKDSDLVFKKCHRVDQKTVTGAGDVWAAANIASYLAKLEPEDRLAFSNSAAGLYVSVESAVTPRLSDIFQFMKNNPIH